MYEHADFGLVPAYNLGEGRFRRSEVVGKGEAFPISNVGNDGSGKELVVGMKVGKE